MAKAHSNVDEDIYEDLDISPKATPSDDILLEGDCLMDVDTESNDLLIVEEFITRPEEAELKKVEKRLYMEILKSEKEKRNKEQLKVSDYDEIKKELLQAKKLIAEKDEQIEKLTKENSNLKMNICSLYKTAKSEADRMELLLRSANEKVDSLLYNRNLPKDYFERLSSQNPNPKQSGNFQAKPNDDRTDHRESSKYSADKDDRSKRGFDSRNQNLNPSSGQHKRLHSPSSDIENLNTRTSTYSNKRQNCDANDIQKTTQSSNKESSDRILKSDSNIVQKGTSLTNDKNLDGDQNITQKTLMKTNHLHRKENCDLNSPQNSACTDHSKNMFKPIIDLESAPKNDSDLKSACSDKGKNILEPVIDLESAAKSTLVQSEDLNKSQNIGLEGVPKVQSVDEGSEPSNEELFFKMQEMINNDPETLNDPDTMNLIFAHMLPTKLKEWFHVYEASQMSALNTLKQSFINSYFEGFSVNTAKSSKGPEENMLKHQNVAFFFQHLWSCSKNDCDGVVPVSDKVSDLKNEPHGNMEEKKKPGS